MKRTDFRGEVWVNVHPAILKAINDANETEVDGGYGEESYAARATELMQRWFDEKIYTTFAINGTAANVMALKAMLDRFSAVLCASQTHVHTYEAGATEYCLGNKILTIDCPDGKLTPRLLDKLMENIKNYHYVPKVVALAQPTELGTVYTVDELRAVCDWAHSHGMFVYVDGARLPNALEALGTDVRGMIGGADVDAFSFGGTKAGAMFGEMIVFRREQFARELKYSQKQSVQHMSKSKFLSTQIVTLLETGLYEENARLANGAAKKLMAALAKKNIKAAYPVQSNMVFAIIPPDAYERITAVFDLHWWNKDNGTVRLATTYLTTDKQIEELVSLI